MDQVMRSSDYSYFERLLDSLSDCSGLSISIIRESDKTRDNSIDVDINRYSNRDFSTVVQVGEYFQPGRAAGTYIHWSSSWSFKSNLGIVLFENESPIMDGSWIVLQYPVSQLLDALRGVPQWVKNEVAKGLPTLVYVAIPKTSFKVGEEYYDFSVDVHWEGDTLVSQPSINSDWPSEVREIISGFASQQEAAIDEVAVEE